MFGKQVSLPMPKRLMWFGDFGDTSLRVETRCDWFHSTRVSSVSYQLKILRYDAFSISYDRYQPDIINDI